MIIDTKAGFNILGVSIRTTTDASLNHDDFKQLWDRFFKEDIQSKVPGKIGPEIVCIYDQYKEVTPGVYSVRATVGCKVERIDNIPDSLNLAAVNEGTYQQFQVKGKMPDAIVQKWTDIWSENSNIRRLFDTDFEIYGPKSYDMENGEMEIYLGIRE